MSKSVNQKKTNFLIINITHSIQMLMQSIFRIFLLLSISIGTSLILTNCHAQTNFPQGYQLLVDEDFEGDTDLSDFSMTDARAWKIQTEGDNHYLELLGGSEYASRVRSPFNIAVLKGMRFGDFVMEVDLLQTGKNYGHRDMCLFFSMKDATNFYYVHMAHTADPHAHNIFLVNDAPRVAIAEKTTGGIDWGDEEWHKVRVVRKVAEGTIQIYFDDMETPIMETTDTHFTYGGIGFGSFDDSGKVDNIKIWGPGFAPEEKSWFE